MLLWSRLDILALDQSHESWPLLGLHGMRALRQAACRPTAGCCRTAAAHGLPFPARVTPILRCTPLQCAPWPCPQPLPTPGHMYHLHVSHCRALKTKGNTPKYGLIFHSSFIGRAKQRNKGRISRYLANKCSIASR